MRGQGRGFGRSGGWQQADLPPAEDAPAWFAGRLSTAWFTGAPEVQVDRDEILVVGTLPVQHAADASDADKAGHEAGLIARFREETRDARIRVAREGEHRYGRKVSWGAVAGGTRELFTTHSAPVMTRLRQPERQVLDTLVDAGVARSRSDALSWCVRLVGRNADTWLDQLRSAMSEVDRVRAAGPDAGPDEAGPNSRPSKAGAADPNSGPSKASAAGPTSGPEKAGAAGPNSGPNNAPAANDADPNLPEPDTDDPEVTR